ncbi:MULTISPECIES: BatA domain-containing protein [Pontibacter]|uniref:BatA domain-containing protein n=1 Tax=Pontibacter TaxID=323449 RepID=UPI001E641CB3|nr:MULTISPECIES: BatA domain-containing protein [Pontibacter]
MAFVYPAFLFALAATGIPVILHLVQLRRAKRIEFSNVRFIKASQEVTASQRKLKDLLILLSRILFVLFLVLAFAQPFLPGTGSQLSVGNDVTVVIDNSYSMQNMHAEKDVSLLTYASDKAKTVFNLFPPASVFSVLDNNTLSSNRYASAGEAVSALNALDYSSNSSVSIKAPTNSHLFLFSEFQRNQFSASAFTKLDSTTQVHLLPLEPASTSNIFIDSVYLEDAFIRSGGEIALHVIVHNSGTEAREDVPVKLLVNGDQLAALSIDLPAKQATEATINFKVGDRESNLAALTIDDYPVEFDNTYYFVLSPSKSVNIIEISDAKTISLKELYSKEPLFNYTLYNAGNVNYARVGEADAVLLNGLESVSTALATTITNYIQEGGTVMVLPPASGSLSGYESFFNQAGIPARLSVPAGNKSELQPPAAANPFFRGIFAEYDKKMQMPSAIRNLSWSRASDDILKYRGGASFLSRFERGKGQIYLMAAPLHGDYNTLVNHALLLPVMYKVAISGYKQEQELAYTLSTNTIKLPITHATAREGIYKLEKDSLSFIPEQQIRGGSLYLNIPPDLNEAGIYNLTLNGEVAGTVAFNYDNRESFLEVYTPDELRIMIGTDRENIHVYDYGDAFSVKNEFEKRYFGVKLWKYCLILCLFFLMAEIALIRFL